MFLIVYETFEAQNSLPFPSINAFDSKIFALYQSLVPKRRQSVISETRSTDSNRNSSAVYPSSGVHFRG